MLLWARSPLTGPYSSAHDELRARTSQQSANVCSLTLLICDFLALARFAARRHFINWPSVVPTKLTMAVTDNTTNVDTIVTTTA